MTQQHKENAYAPSQPTKNDKQPADTSYQQQPLCSRHQRSNAYSSSLNLQLEARKGQSSEARSNAWYLLAVEQVKSLVQVIWLDLTAATTIGTHEACSKDYGDILSSPSDQSIISILKHVQSAFSRPRSTVLILRATTTGMTINKQDE